MTELRIMNWHLTNNKHGEVAKYYSYNKHQMVPDMLVANLKFLNSLSDVDYQIFKEAAALSTEVELEEWEKVQKRQNGLRQKIWVWSLSM